MSDGVSGLLETLRAALAPDYEVQRVLGTGGMGAVFLAKDLTLDRLVAVKVVAPDLASSAALRQRFLREARTIARLRHQSIVDVYSAGEADGLLYFIMQYVPGESLRDYLDREKRVSPGRTAVILRDLAEALAYAHGEGSFTATSSRRTCSSTSARARRISRISVSRALSSLLMSA